jgi:hypothetical protein
MRVADTLSDVFSLLPKGAIERRSFKLPEVGIEYILSQGFDVH